MVRPEPQWREANGIRLTEEKTLRYGDYTARLVAPVKFPWMIAEFASSSVGGDKAHG